MPTCQKSSHIQDLMLQILYWKDGFLNKVLLQQQIAASSKLTELVPLKKWQPLMISKILSAKIHLPTVTNYLKVNTFWTKLTNLLLFLVIITSPACSSFVCFIMYLNGVFQYIFAYFATVLPSRFLIYKYFFTVAWFHWLQWCYH